VTREEIRKLIGGYATGTLTEAEQKLLFDAALDDQELFDELSHEQTLKEMLDEPGARERLIAALGQPKPKRFVWWPWAAAGTAIAAVVVAIVVIRPPAKQEIAMVTLAPAPVVKGEVAQPAPPVPAPVKQKAANKPAAAAGTAAVDAATPQAQAPPPPPAERALSVGRLAFAPANPTSFAFDYAIEPEGTLRITPSAGGYLRVVAMNGDTAGPALDAQGAGPDGRVQAGSQVSVNVSGRDAVEIVFSASPSQAAAQPPIRRDELSGTVADPAPSPASSLTVVISVKPIR
jgi:hypothetical protein